MVDGIFADFDKLRKGRSVRTIFVHRLKHLHDRVTANEFVRSVSGIAGLALTEQEMAVLVEPYRIPESPSHVAYPLFEKQVNSGLHTNLNLNGSCHSVSVHASGHCHKSCHCMLLLSILSSSHIHTQFGSGPIETEKDSKALSELIDRVGYTGYSRRILIKPQFLAFDRNKNGSVFQFAACNDLFATVA